MLTLRAAKGPDIYERPEFARDDYYSERGEVRGEWVGRGADLLGLWGGPAEGDLGMLLEGRDPASGEVLAGTARRADGNVAFDLTFAAPKSVSVLAAVGDEVVRRAVLDAHAVGMCAGLDYLEREACFVRRGRNGVTVLPAEGFVGVLYVHEMARSGDPHLHAHLVIANRVRGPDGRWSAPDMRPVYAHAKTAGTIADAVMRAELSRSLGVEWGPVTNGIAELVAVPASVREHFSARHAEIMEEALARGLTSMAGVAAIQRETRDRKRVIAREEAVAGWRARAAEHGFGERELHAALGRSCAITTSDYTERLRAKARQMLGPHGLTRQSSTFTRREVIQALAEVHSEGAPAGHLEHLADQLLCERCVALARPHEDLGSGSREPLYTVPDMLAAEVRLIDAAAGRDPADYLAHARHGYALTGHVSQGESVDRTFVLASPERGGAEWAYVAGSRHRHDLHVFVTHHESEDVEEALARAWSRSQAKSLALDLVDRAVRDGAIAAVRADLDAATPERLLARAGELRAAREAARQTAASVPNHERARVAALRGALARAEQGAKDAESRAGRLGDRLDRIPVWRRRERAEVRSTIERARRDLQRHEADGNAARGELAGLGPALARAADVEGARSQARGLGQELDAVQKRLEGWRVPDLDGRGRPTSGHERAQRPIDRNLGRGR